MQIIFDLSDDIAQQLKAIPNLDAFMNKAVKSALQKEVIENPSKWKLIAQEIESNPELQLNGYSEQLKKDTLEVRENFFFSSD